MYLAKIDYSDVTYTSVTAVLMSAVEPSLAVMLACIPLLRPLVGRSSRRFSTARRRTGKSPGLSTWMLSKSKSKSRSKTLQSSRKRSTFPPGGSVGLLRMGSSEGDLGLSEMRSAVLSHSRYDSDEVELRYVLSPGEGVSHSAHVEAGPQRDDVSVENEAIRHQIQDGEAGKPGSTYGIAIVVKQEWNVASEPKVPP